MINNETEAEKLLRMLFMTTYRQESCFDFTSIQLDLFSQIIDYIKRKHPTLAYNTEAYIQAYLDAMKDIDNKD